MQNQTKLSIFFIKNIFYSIFSVAILSSPFGNKPKKHNFFYDSIIKNG